MARSISVQFENQVLANGNGFAVGAIDESLTYGALNEAANGLAELAVPTNALEEAVGSIYSEVLSIPTVGRHDNVFLLGGDSLRGS
jgi:hypothetical protein